MDEPSDHSRSGDDHDHEHVINQEDCPLNVCQCDVSFVSNLLAHHKKCISGEDTSLCLNQSYKHGIFNLGSSDFRIIIVT